METRSDCHRAAWVQNAEKLDSNIIYDRDFDYDYFGFKVCNPCLPSARVKILMISGSMCVPSNQGSH